MPLYTWENTQKVLVNLAPAMLDKYKELGNTENVTVRVGELEVILHLPPYWEYIERGRGPGKFPPPEAIRNWIEVKHIVPRNDTTVPQLTYLISRKIAREGTKGKHALEGTVDFIKNEFFPQLYLAIGQDVGNNISKIVKNG